MGRILAIDYGRKRCGIAVTDVLRISANGLPTVATGELLKFLKAYIAQEEVDEIVIGEPRDLQGNPSDSMRYIRPFIGNLGDNGRRTFHVYNSPQRDDSRRIPKKTTSGEG